MSSRSEIRFNFRTAIKQAEKLEETADDLRSLSNQSFQQSLEDLSACWKGDNASAYIKKGEALRQEMAETARELDNIASDIRRIAKRIYDAEMEALRIANERDY